MHLYHFSDTPDIDLFIPRPVRVPVERPEGLDWLNGPLVWATDELHQVMYFFPRECPRILLWTTPETTAKDYEFWWRGSTYKRLAYIEHAWLERLQSATLYRYEMPPRTFRDIHDVGMWVSQSAVRPLGLETLNDLIGELAAHEVELRVVESLVPLKGVWRTSLHASGIRLRNVQGWGKPTWTHSRRGRVVPVSEPE